MNITPGVGIDDIKLGITQEELLRILGKPDKIANIEFIGEVRYIYNELMMTFCFWLEDSDQLYLIDSSNEELCLWNQKIIGMYYESIVNLLREHKVLSVELQDYESFEVINCEDIGVDFVLEFNHIQSVHIGDL